MACTQLAIPNQIAHILGQIQESQQVGNMAAAFRKSFSQLFLRVTETIHQLAVGQSLFYCVQVSTLNVFNDPDLKNFGIIKFTNQHGHFMQLRHLRSTPAAFTCNNFILLRIRYRANDKWLKNTLLCQRLRELFKVFRSEMAAWLIGVGLQALNRKNFRFPGSHRRSLARLHRCHIDVSHKSRQTATQSAPFHFLFHSQFTSGLAWTSPWLAPISRARPRYASLPFEAES
ncbi:MAG: hypothetical protein A2092_19625 [Rhodobacteraceae bacterium GWE1_64_9]|nr:MAG: hypothetical protein A2092_19625 [Rhodobacteraceae bacterium GWE1_64_9]OHC47798.1 MAG: hypothetical protein A2X69_07200 [Rhodobacteraceae bacterium GWF1_65_7]